MNKEILQKLVLEGKSSHKIAKELKVSQTTIRYWLKKYNINISRTSLTSRQMLNKLKCNRCKGIFEKENFYINKKNNRISYMCKKCHNKYHYEKQKQKKLDLIEYKGGKCVHCHIKSDMNNYVIFDFHHLNPSEKESPVKTVNWSLERLKKEADKCILLCSNCHRIEHKRLFTEVNPRTDTALKD